MTILTQPAFGPRTALAYVTGGTLIDVWTLVWYFTRDHELTRSEWFWVAGLVLTGLTFVLLGFFLGPLGRAARQAELPPVQATRAETDIQKVAAANPAQVIAPQPTTGAAVVAPGQPAPPAGQVVAQPSAPVRMN